MIRLWLIVLLFSFSSSSFLQEAPLDGTIERIEIFGNKLTRTQTLINELQSVEGKTFNIGAIDEDRRRLMKTGILWSVEAQIKRGSSPDKWVIVYIVREKYPWMAQPKIYSNRLFGYSYGFTVEHLNFRGRAESLAGRFLFGGIQDQSVRWQVPRLCNSSCLFASASASHLKFQYRYADYLDRFQYQRFSLKCDLGVRLSNNLKVGLSAYYEQAKVSDRRVSIESDGIDTLPSYGMFCQYDSRNWNLYPTSGWLIISNLKIVQPKHSNFDWYRIDCRRYQLLPYGDLLAMRAVVYLSDGDLPVYERVHMGGWRSLRGYRFGSFSGDNMVTASLEYRFPFGFVPDPKNLVNIGIAGIAFFESGKTWWRGESLKLGTFKNCVGVGLQLLVHVIVLRLEYGYSGQGKGLIHLSSGVEF